MFNASTRGPWPEQLLARVPITYSLSLSSSSSLPLSVSVKLPAGSVHTYIHGSDQREKRYLASSTRFSTGRA